MRYLEKNIILRYLSRKKTKMSPKIIEQLAPKGVLRVAINLSNFLLVTDRSAEGNPAGVSPDMAAEVARRLGVGIEYVEYKTPGEIADDAGKDAWDIANIGAEPQRAEKIDFTRAYCEIQATYLVPPGSPLKSIKDSKRIFKTCLKSQPIAFIAPKGNL